MSLSTPPVLSLVSRPVFSSQKVAAEPNQPAYVPQTPAVGAPFGIATNQRNRFVVLGDAGTGDAGQWRIAQKMLDCQPFLPFQSVLVLGDNVYQAGEPQHFEARIRRPYQTLRNQGVQFYPVLGNHDVSGGYSDLQLAYWGVPAFYKFTLGSPGSQVDFWAIDTTVLLPGASGCYTTHPEIAQRKAALQLDWLARSLAQSTAPMKVVFGHYPLYSQGALAKTSRTGYQMLLANMLEPLLQRYGVDVYMAGHEHHYESPRRINGVYHLVSGAGGKLDGPQKGIPEQPGIIKQRHFMIFEITPQGLLYGTISEQGQILDSGLIPRKTQPTLPPPATPVPHGMRSSVQL